MTEACSTSRRTCISAAFAPPLKARAGKLRFCSIIARISPALRGLAILTLLLGAPRSTPAAGALLDTPFLQEIAEQPAVPSLPPGGEFRSIALDGEDRVWLAGSSGVWWKSKGEKEWHSVTLPGGSVAPVFQVVAGSNDGVWVSAWNGLYLCQTGAVHQVIQDSGPISRATAAGRDKGDYWAAGPEGLWTGSGITAPRSLPLSAPATIRALAASPDGSLLAIGSPTGLWIQSREPIAGRPRSGRVSREEVRSLAWSGQNQLWAAGLGHVTVYDGKSGRVVRTLDATQRLPHSEVQVIALDAEGTAWIGTAGGVARWRKEEISVLRSRRWLPDDDVRGIAFDSLGGTWIATKTGVSLLQKRSLSLEEKSGYFETVCEARHVRPPGIVEKCRLRVPGDLTTWEPQDDDNDGGYTAVYMAMQSFRFAATQREDARAKAERSFEALKFLRQVTGNPGFLARTVIPSSWTRMADPNEILTPAEIAERRVEDGRFKYVPKRWRLSSDGKWLWKGDTSSDEVCAHMFGYFFYYELAASEVHKQEIREQVGSVMDHILSHDFTLRDQDGKPTRWGVWTPERLLNDPNWANESGINAVELLSFLKVAHHVTGRSIYAEQYLKRIQDPRWRALVLEAKNLSPNTRTHIDDELLAFVYAPLLILEQDPGARRLLLQSLERWHEAVKPDATPFFEVLYAALTGKKSALGGVVEILRDTPLDLVRWEVDNSTREDVRLVRLPEREHWQTDRLLPPGERGVPRTDDNPRLAKQGDGGRTESDGVFWQLPYWMARHYGFIHAAAPALRPASR